MFKMLKKQKGMTLVELLAVMVIIGIIAAISIPAIGTLMENSRKDAAISTAQSLQEAARLYVVGEGTVTTGTVFCASDSCNSGSGNTTNINLVEEGYLDAVAVDPTKKPYTTATVTITISDDGEVSYSTKLDNNGKYDLEGDAKTLERDDIS